MSFYVSRPSNFNGFCLAQKHKGAKLKTLICYDEFVQLTGYRIPKGTGFYFSITKLKSRKVKDARSRATD